MAGPLDLQELQKVQAQLDRQRKQLEDILPDHKHRPLQREHSVAVLTWPGDGCSALVVSTKPGRAWVRTIGEVSTPERVSLCPGLDGSAVTELVVNARFEFSDGVLLELKLR